MRLTFVLINVKFFCWGAGGHSPWSIALDSFALLEPNHGLSPIAMDYRLLPLPYLFRLLLKNDLTSSAHSFSRMPPVMRVLGWVIF